MRRRGRDGWREQSLRDLVDKRAPRQDRFRYEWEELKQKPLSSLLEENKAFLADVLVECSDAVFRDFRIEQSGTKALLVFIDGLVRTELVDMSLLRSLLIEEGGEGDIGLLRERSLNATQLTAVEEFGTLFRQLFNGDTILLVDGNDSGIAVGYRGAEHRNVSEPETESVIRGPREGFTENLRTNTALLRRRLKTPRLKMKSIVAGKETQTNLVISYLEGIVHPNLVQEVVARLEKIDVDGILESGYVEELIQDEAWSLFPQIMHTERPDTVAASLLEGRVAVMVDGTPFVLLMPATFWSMMQASEDYYAQWPIATLIRLLRLFLLGVALLMPALYIAVTTFHQEMLPTPLLLSVAAAREAIPFPAVVEAFIMEVSFEALREAGIRLPRTVGQAVSILGALVVGTAAVEAGIVSAPMVIVVSITGIASFAIPRFNLAIAIRILRFPLMIIASVLGIFGIVLGTMLIMGHLARLRTFGVPYFLPLAPINFAEWSDTFIRAPIWKNTVRPVGPDPVDPVRMDMGMASDIAAEGGMKGEHKEK